MEYDADGNPIAADPAVTPPPVIADPTGGDAPVAAAEAPKPGLISLTPEELDAKIANGVIAGLKEFQKQSAPPPKPATPAAAVAYDPATESLSMLRASTRMNSEALSMYPDLPEEYRERIQDELEKVVPEQIAGFRQAGLHKIIANSIAMEATQAGKYTPTKLRPASTTPAPRLEPIGGGQGPVGQAGIPVSRASEIQEIWDVLGLGKATDADLRVAHTAPNTARG